VEVTDGALVMPQKSEGIDLARKHRQPHRQRLAKLKADELVREGHASSIGYSKARRAGFRIHALEIHNLSILIMDAVERETAASGIEKGALSERGSPFRALTHFHQR
jgi:hypothetical protein